MEKRFLPIGYKTCVRLGLTILWLCFSTFMLGGCSSTDSKPESIFDRGAQFQVEIPEQFKLDEQINPNDAVTSTWFREDGLALIAVDRQPLAGKRLEILQEQGKNKYLSQISKELASDLSTNLEHYSHFERKVVKLGEEKAVDLSFHTRRDGEDYKAHILLCVQNGEPPHEIMMEFRLPLDEADDDTVWSGLKKSWHWGEAKEGHGEEKSDSKDDQDGEKDDKKSGH